MESFIPVISIEPTEEGQLMYRLGVFVAFFSFCYWAVTQPSEFDGFVKGQGDFICTPERCCRTCPRKIIGGGSGGEIAEKWKVLLMKKRTLRMTKSRLMYQNEVKGYSC